MANLWGASTINRLLPRVSLVVITSRFRRLLLSAFAGLLVLLYTTIRCSHCVGLDKSIHASWSVSYTHLRAHETRHDLVCRLLLEKKKNIPGASRTSAAPRDLVSSRNPVPNAF